MLVISNRLTTGEITFILRVVVQILSYGGLFLIGLIILGYTPHAAPVETHDMLNRVVGKSTATKSTIKWIVRRVFGRNRDPNSSAFLLVALVLSLCYGLFVSLSDVGFIGLQACSIAGNSFQDFPASIQSESSARAAIALSMLNGTDPSSVHSYRCDNADDFVFSVNVTERVCSKWHNSTYGDANEFRSLNSTDSDVLVLKNLARYNNSRSNEFDMNTYFVGPTGMTVTEPTIQGGMAVVPHATGVKMIVGVPQLTRQQKTTVPKTLGVEVEIGCLPLGMIGMKNSASMFSYGTDFFVPDDQYKSQRDAKYTGPDYLKPTLQKTADAIRDLMRPWYNASAISSTGYLMSYNDSYGQFDWQTRVTQWYPPSINGTNLSDSSRLIIGNCTQQVHAALNVTALPPSMPKTGQACSLYQLRGSFFDTGSVLQGHAEMVCASATSVNMVSATLEVDAMGKLVAADLTRLPSDLNIVRASFYDTIHNKPQPGDTTYAEFDPIERYTLADNPNGNLQHFIFQKFTFGASASSLSHGAGSAGTVFSEVGSSMVNVGSTDDPTLSLVDSQYFSANNFSSSVITRWAGGVGASYFLASLGYNGWAALGQTPVLVESTGGEVATCYNLRYGIAFVPLVLSAVLIMIWTLHMLIAARLRGSKKSEAKYGGLAPAIVTPIVGKPPSNTVLVWEDHGEQTHLRPMFHGGVETEMLVSPHMMNEYSK